MVTRRTFQTPATAPEMVSEAVAKPAGEVSAPPAADAASPETTPGAPTEPADAVGEAGAADVTTAPESALQRAEAALAATEKELAWLARERDAALLADADDEAIRLYGQIEVLQRTRRALTDKVALLSVQAAEFEAAEAARSREAKIVEVERTLIERDAAVADLRDALVSANRAFQRVHELNLQARAGWGWGHGKLGGVLTTSHDLVRETQSYLYKIGGKAPQSGGQYDPDVAPQFPGGRSPRIEMLQQPDRLPDIVAQYREASKYASDTMRGVVPEPVPASPDTTGANAPVAEQSPARPAAGITGGQSNVPPITPEMAEIIRRQVQLAMRDDPESEAEYLRNGELLREMSA